MYHPVDGWRWCYCWSAGLWRRPGCCFARALVSHLLGPCRGLLLCLDLLFGLNCQNYFELIYRRHRLHLVAAVAAAYASQPQPFLESVPLELPRLVGYPHRSSSCCYQHRHRRGSCPIRPKKIRRSYYHCLCENGSHCACPVRAGIGAAVPMPPWPGCDRRCCSWINLVKRFGCAVKCL